MKNLALVAHPRGWTGYEVRTEWKGKVLRKKFSIRKHGGDKATLEKAKAWLTEATRRQRKPLTDAWVRSRGTAGRAGKRYDWQRK